MAITIQDLLASDTISQAVDKINFNFDQLLLNGGGPVGPPGPLGPSGPIGGRGERGSEWYEGTDNPNITPPGPGIIPLQYDKYLQDNGQVWEYTGLTWFDTGINLTGQTGPQGTAVGFGQFGNDGAGNYVSVNNNVSYPSLFAAPDAFVTTQNQGVPVASFGIASPSDSNPGFLNDKFKITSTLAGALDSSILSVLIRQGDSGSSAIKFMGGGEIAAEHYEQNDLSKLSSISLGTDDTFTTSVPKEGTAGDSNQYVGYIVDVAKRGHQYRAGNGMEFTTGTKGTSLLAGDDSNVTFTLNQLTGSTVPTFTVDTIGTLSQTQARFGPTAGILNLNPVYTGGAKFEVSDFGVAANSNITLLGGGTVKSQVGTNQVGAGTTSAFITTNASPIYLFSQSGDIELQTNNTGDIRIDTHDSGITYLNSDEAIKIDVADPLVALGGSLLIDTEVTELISIGPATTGVNLMINSNSGGQKMQIGLGASNNSGAIEIGRPFGAVPGYFINAGIKLNYAATTLAGTQDDKINVTGRVAFMLQGTPPSAVASGCTIFVDTGTAYYPIGSKIVQNGNPLAYLNPAVLQEVWYDFDNSSITIGKGNAFNNAPDGQHGFFLNDSKDFPQGGVYPNPAAGSGDYNPAGEKFKVDKHMTKVSNRMVWGGQNGISGLGSNNITPAGEKIDCFTPVLPFPDIEVNGPFLRIMVGPWNISNYNYISAQNGNIYDFGPLESDMNFNLLPPPENWAHGQRLHVELLSVTGHITVDSPPPATSTAFKANWNLRMRHTQRIQGTTNRFSNYIGTGYYTGAFPVLSAPPRWQRVNYTLQWSGFEETYVNGNMTNGPVFQNDFTPGWSLVGPPVYQRGALGGGGSTGANMSTYLFQGLEVNEYVITAP